MSSRTFPSTGEKPSFDPNASYEAVQDTPTPKGKKPTFNPKATYDPVVTEEAVQEQPKPKQQEQTQVQFKPMTDWLNVPSQKYKPMVEANVVPIDDHTIKTAQASDRVNAHIQDIDRNIGNLIYNNKKDIEGRSKSILLGGNPKEGMPVSPQVAEIESKLRPQTTVTNDEIQQFKAEMAENPGMVRTAINQRVKDLSKTNPSEANRLKADIYRLDRQDNPDKENKISKNVDKIIKGDVDYDPLRGVLYTPHGFLGSLALGFRQKNELFKDYELYTKTDNESAIISELNSKIKEQDPDTPIDVPVGTSGEAGAMIGGQPIKPIVGGAIANYLGTPIAGAAAASGISAHEMYKLGYASALQMNYAEIKRTHPEMADYTAYQQAKELAEKQATVDAATGAAMGFVGGEAALKPTNIATPLLQNSVRSGLKQIGEEGAKKIMEGLGVGAIGASGQVVKNLMSQKAGIPVDTMEGTLPQLVGGVTMTAGIAMLAKAPKLLKKSTYNEIVHSVAKLPEHVIDQEFNNLQETGYISTEELQAAQKAIRDQKQLNASIPEDIPELDRLKVQAKIKERNLLQEELERVDKAYHPDIKEDIKKLDEEIVNISKGADRGELQKVVDKEFKKGNIEGFVTDTLRNATEKELEGYFKDIAEQAADPNSLNQTIETFGEEIVNKAKELYPQSYTEQINQQEVDVLGMLKASKVLSAEEKRILYRQYKQGVMSESEISKYTHVDIADIKNGDFDKWANVLLNKNKGKKINAEDIDFEEFKTKPEENAVQIGGPEEVSMGETPGDSQQMGEGIPDSGEVAGAQGATEGESAGQSETKMSDGIPPNMFDLPFNPEDGDVGRLAHADTEKIYSELGLTDRIPRATKDDITLEREADSLIRDGYDFEGKADRLLSGRDKSMTDTEQVAFAKMVGALNVKLKNLEVNTPEFNSTLDAIERLSRASDKAGSEEGAAFRARRMFMLNDETLSSFFQQAKDANLGVPLTEEQAAGVKARYDDMQASRDAYRARVEKLAAENAKLKAEGVLKKAVSEKKQTSKSRTHEDYVNERKDIIAKMRDDLLKVAKGEKGAMISLPGTAQLAAIAPHVAKLVKSLIEEGIEKLPEIINNIHEQLKDVVEGISEKNIHDIIAGEYSKKQTKNDLQEKAYEIHLQAKYINRLEALKAGPQPKSNRARLLRSAEIEDLRKQIKELQGRPEKAESEKLIALKSRYKKMTEEIQRKIDAGDFEPEEKNTIELDKEAQTLKEAYVKKKIEWQKQIAQNAYNNRTRGQKGWDRFREFLGIPRTLMASVDLSAPLRQGLVLTTSHPLMAAKAFAESIRQAINPDRFDKWLYDLKESDYYKNVLSKFGLYIADPNNLHLSAKEEAFMTNLAEKIPIIGETLKVGGKKLIPGAGLISKSERAYVAYLNKLRVDVFTMYAKDLADRGITPQTRPDVYEGLGAFINAATGRGELGDLEPAAKVLNSMFFSPRLIASRINLLNPVWYASLPKEVRLMALNDMANLIMAGTTTLTLFAMIPGVKVEANPNSPDFGKIHAGDTRWDIWGGFQQYIRVASQLMSGVEKKSNGNIVPLGSGFGQHTKADKLFSFFRGKLAPVPSIGLDVLSGRTAVGADVNLTDEVKEHLTPMIINDVKDAWQEQGPMSLLYTGLPSFVGVGTTTYESGGGGSVNSGTKPTKVSKTKISKPHKPHQ